MLRKLIIVSVLALMLNVSGKAQTYSSALQELRDSYIEALKNSDTGEILKVYSKNASVHNIDGTMLKGSREIGDFYDSFFENSKATIEFKNVSEDKLAKNLVFYHDEVYLQIKGEDLEKIEVVNIAEKKNGEWRVIKSYRWPMPSN